MGGLLAGLGRSAILLGDRDRADTSRDDVDGSGEEIHVREAARGQGETLGQM